MGKNAIVGQSGGPTSVINASLAGVFESCKSRGAEIVYGMCNGVAGLLEDRVVDLSTVLTDDLDIELLKRTPSSFLGSCRYKLPDWHDDETVYKKLFAILEKLNIGYFFYIGGNGPDKEPGRNIPPASNYRRGGCGKPNAPGRYAYRLEHGDAQTGKKCGDPARRLRTGHCAALAGGLPAARFPRTLRHLDRQDAARAARSGLAHG